MTSIFVAKLDFSITSEQLKQAFDKFGVVNKASVATDKESGKSRGFGFVEMANRDEAMSAIEALDGSTMNGRTIAVKEAENRQDNRPSRDQSSGPRNEFNKNRENFNASQRNPSAPRPSFKSPQSIPSADEPVVVTTPPLDFLKNDFKKKKDDKKAKDWDAEKGAKKPKMSAYKKSGKNNKFFDDDEDEDWDLTSSFNQFEGEEDEEEEFDD